MENYVMMFGFIVTASFLVGFFMALGMALASYLFPVVTNKRVTYDNLDK